MNKFQTDMIDAAITYADKGWHVLPVCQHTKRPLLTDWPNHATTDDRTIVRWWLKKYSTAGIGVLTGPRSGFFVVDIDVKQDTNGNQSLYDRFGDELSLDMDQHLTQTTSSGGIHLLFKWDDTLAVRTRAGILPGVDTRGIGGQIVVAPSQRDGKRYQWNDLTLPIAEIPPWVKQLVAEPSASTDKRLHLKGILEGVSHGSRDDQIFRFASLLRGQGIPRDVALPFVLTAAQKCIPPLDTSVAIRKIEDAYRKYPENNMPDTFQAMLDWEKTFQQKRKKQEAMATH